MRRSLLFIPGNNPGMLQTADVFEADSIIIDLEDAISLFDKDSARNLTKSFLESFPVQKEVIIRVNSIDSKYFTEDLDIIVTDKIDTIMLPKAMPEDIIKLDNLLSKIEKEKKLKKKIKVIPLVELAKSVLIIEEIVKIPRVDGVLLGAEDLASDMEVSRTNDSVEILYPRAKVALACIAAKIEAIDTPFISTLDIDGLIKDANFAKSLGFKAKACIHPNQVSYVNSVFSPSKEQIEFSLRVLEGSKSNIKGAFSIDGKMIDKPIIERAEKIISRAKRFGLL